MSVAPSGKMNDTARCLRATTRLSTSFMRNVARPGTLSTAYPQSAPAQLAEACQRQVAGVASGGHHDLRHEPTREVARSSVLDQCQHLVERLGRHVDPADIEREPVTVE